MKTGEYLEMQVTFTAQCGEKNPVQRFINTEEYKYDCRACGNPVTIKTLFLSPKGEVEGFFGAVYHCESCAPDLAQIASNSDLFYGYIFGNIK